MEENKKKKISTKDMVQIAMFTAVVAVLSQIAIPMPSGVPVTLQTLAVALCGYVLGSKRERSPCWCMHFWVLWAHLCSLTSRVVLAL